VLLGPPDEDWGREWTGAMSGDTGRLGGTGGGALEAMGGDGSGDKGFLPMISASSKVGGVMDRCNVELESSLHNTDAKSCLLLNVGGDSTSVVCCFFVARWGLPEVEASAVLVFLGEADDCATATSKCWFGDGLPS
jgi:hypothetical protein